MLDYIIVGAGLAGISLGYLAKKDNKKIHIFNDTSQPSSQIAGGLYNPVVLKRFTDTWKSTEQLAFSLPFYKDIEKHLDAKFLYEMPIYRKFASVEEQNNWFAASDHPVLYNYFVPEIIHQPLSGIKAPMGFGKLNYSGYLDIACYLQTLINHFNQNNLISPFTFQYDQLAVYPDYVVYNNTIQARKIIFSEGFGLASNPYFGKLPLDGTKGELLLIHAPDLQENVIVKSNIFLMPIGNATFKVGATYNWEDKTQQPTLQGRKELEEKLAELITCPYTIIDHKAGVRPTVKDRRPLLGKHPKYSNLYVFNGLGTRGVLLAPYLANHLYEHIEHQIPLYPEVSLERFNKPKYHYFNA